MTRFIGMMVLLGLMLGLAGGCTPTPAPEFKPLEKDVKPPQEKMSLPKKPGQP